MPEEAEKSHLEKVSTEGFFFFHFLELQPDQYKLIESPADHLRYALTWSMLFDCFDPCPSLMIKDPGDDAVL